MLVDGIKLIEGSSISNASVETGTTFPTIANAGELFFKSTDSTLYVYSGSAWVPAGTGDASILTGTTLAANVVSSSLTSVGTLSALTVTAPITGSVTGSSGSTTGNAATATVLATPRAINGVSFDGSANITVAAAGSTLTGTSLASSIVSSSLTSVGTLDSLTVTGNAIAATPTLSTHLTTKSYVDSLVQGLSWKNSVRAATTANITLSGTQTVDGVALVAGDRVLVKSQTTATQNGVYIVAAGAWTRSVDMDGSPDVGEVNGAAVYATDGTTNGDTTWTQTATIAAVGTQAMVFAQLSGSSTVNASTLSGTTLNPTVVNSSLTSVGTITSGTWAGSYGGFTATNTAGAYVSGGGTPGLTFVNGGTGSWRNASLVSQIDGSLTWTFYDNSLNTGVTFLNVGRVGSSSTASTITFASNVFNLAVGAGGLQLNSSSGTAGQVLTSNGTGAAPTWATPSGGTATALSGTSTMPGNGTTGGVYAGLQAGANTAPLILLTYGSNGTNSKNLEMGLDGNAAFFMEFTNDAVVTVQRFYEVSRVLGTNTAALTTITSNGLNLAISTGGLQLNGSAGTSGQVLTSNGSAAAPTWQTPSGAAAAAGSLTGTALAATVVSSSLTTVGTLSALAVTGTTTQTGALNLAGASSPLQVGASAGTAGQVLTSAGAGLTPTWTTSASAANLPRVTSITSAVVGKRAAVTTAQTITATTWTGGGSIAVGDVYSIYNDSATAITLTAGAGLTLYKDGSATSVATVQLQPRGSCVIWYNTVTEAIINGSIA